MGETVVATGCVTLLQLLLLATAPSPMDRPSGPPPLAGLPPIERVVLEAPIPPPPAPGHEGDPPSAAGIITDRGALDRLAAELAAAPSCWGSCQCRGELVVKVYTRGSSEPTELWLKAADGRDAPTRFERAEGHGCLRISDALADMLRDAVTDPVMRARIDDTRMGKRVAQRAGRVLRGLMVIGGSALAALLAGIMLSRRRRHRGGSQAVSF